MISAPPTCGGAVVLKELADGEKHIFTGGQTDSAVSPGRAPVGAAPAPVPDVPGASPVKIQMAQAPSSGLAPPWRGSCLRRTAAAPPEDPLDVPWTRRGSGLSPVSYTHLDVYKRQLGGHHHPQDRLSV